MKLKIRFFQLHYGICFIFCAFCMHLSPGTRSLPGESMIKAEWPLPVSPDTVTDMDGF
ncbi:MAG TPA: hypothetical protein PKM27_10270 [Saprospiraceae bacterium]|nr:hypothetical protein [Saprospiraceae bacterium]HNT21445.1 hypothetical protein [Saprospiraceae bacterium]